MRSSRFAMLAAVLGIIGSSGSRVLLIDNGISLGTRRDPKPRTSREITPARQHRPGNYRGQSLEAAQTAIAAAEAKRARRIDRNKRLAGDVV